MAVVEPRDRSMSDPQIRRALKWSVLDGVLHAVMVGTGESYLGALAVELGHQDTALAILVTVPMLAGALAQLAAGPLANALGGRKRLVLLGAGVQALSQAGFVAIAFLDVRDFWPLLLVKVFFWGSGMLIAPPWGAWMASLTADVDRQRYFAWRSAVIYLALLAGFGGAGLALHSARSLSTFAALHVVALVARTGSTAVLGIQAELPSSQPARRPMLRAMVEAVRRSRFQTAVYLAVLMLGAYVSVPFYTPYMLRELRLDYATFASLTAVPIVIKAVSSPLLHRVALKIGMRALMLVGGGGIAAVALVWGLSSDLAGLFFAQTLSGLAWGTMEFASFQLLLASADDEHRVEFLSLASCLTGVTQLAGSLLGSALVAAGLAYRHVFLISAAGRALPLIPLARQFPRAYRAIPRLFMRLISVRPAGGAQERPILGASREDPEGGPER